MALFVFVRPTAPSALATTRNGTGSLITNPLRMVLSLLGIIIGIGSAVAITSTGQGAQKLTETQLQPLGMNTPTVMVRASRTDSIIQGNGSISMLSWVDTEAIAAQATVASAITASLQTPTVQTVDEAENILTAVIKTDSNSQRIMDLLTKSNQRDITIVIITNKSDGVIQTR
ncbi:ABC transporter permease [Phormidium tenue FACHB-886]|nr:ABC transporter permease [Phormidium tenue FACHB-886]